MTYKHYKDPPLVKGGQGRDAEELISDAGCVGWMLLGFMACIVFSLVYWRCSP